MAALERPKAISIEDVEREIEPCFEQRDKEPISESFHPDGLDEFFNEHWFLETGFWYTAFWLFNTHYPGTVLRFKIQYLPCGHVTKAVAVAINNQTRMTEVVSVTRWLADNNLLPEELAD